ncbi:MAG: CRTAC1 family protein [Acidimicrobiia bacterium]
MSKPRRTVVALVLGVVAGLVLAGGVALGLVRYFDSDLPEAAYEPPRFVRETAGIEHSYDGEFQYFVGGGVAVFDCDGNQKPDLFLAGGVNPSAVYRNESPTGGSLRFEQVAAPEAELEGVTGAYPIDVDSDGLADLAVLRAGENVMLRGLGSCEFEPANDRWGIDGGNDWTVAFSAKWDAGASMPTLAFGNYVDLDDRTRCSDHQLFRPVGATYAVPEILTPGWCTLSILFSDWDRSGRRDLRMTNDRHYYRDGEEQLWRVQAGEPARLYTHDEGWQPMKIWGMGIASHDLTGDGLPEVYLTSQSDNKLQTLAAGSSTPNYEDIAFELGATAHRPFSGDVNLPSTAWHPQFEDVNNDGLVDLFVSKGNVEAMADYAAEDPNNLLLQNPDGTFTESAVEAGIVDFGKSRGAALADLNQDGLLDLVVVVRRENVAVWRNTGAESPKDVMGNWVALRLQQPAPNRDAIGAWIEVKVGRHVQHRELTIGGGHAGGILGWAHFGLAEASSAEVRVIWPDGEVGPWTNVAANQFVTVAR